MCAASVAASASASSLELFGFGARGMALAGTSEAVARDYFATYVNPGNLTAGSGVHAGLGIDVLRSSFAIDRVAGQTRWPSSLPPDSLLAHVGVSSPIGGWFANRLAVGVVAHIPVTGPARIDAHDHRTPQLVLYDTLPDRLVVAFGAGVRVTSWLSVGASGQLLATLAGSGDFSLGLLDRRFTERHVDIDLLSEVFPILGVALHPGDRLRIGLVWRAEAMVRYGLPIHVDIEEVGPVDFEVRGLGMYTPDIWALAGAWRFDGGVIATVGLAWQRWSMAPMLAPDVSFSLSDTALREEGADAAPLLEAASIPVPIGGRDIVIPRMGIEWHAGDWWTLRAGAAWRPTPLPRADGVANYLDAPALTLASGVSFIFSDPLGVARRPLQVDLGAGWTRLSRRTVVKLDPDDPVVATSVHGGALHFALTIHHDF